MKTVSQQLDIYYLFKGYFDLPEHGEVRYEVPESHISGRLDEHYNDPAFSSNA